MFVIFTHISQFIRDNGARNGWNDASICFIITMLQCRFMSNVMRDKKNSYVNRKLNILLLVLLMVVALVSGCSKNADTEAEEELIIADTSETTGIYTMATCEYADVVLTKTITCTYVQAAEQKVVMDVGGRRISRVCVRTGDHVNIGDVLLLLDADNLEEQIEDLRYRIEKQELELSYLEDSKKFDELDTYYGYVFGSGLNTEDDLKELEKSNAMLNRDYKYRREDLEDAIEYDKLELANLTKRLSDSQVCATLSGMVYSIEKDLEGATTKKDQEIMTIASEDEGYFMTDDSDVFGQIEIQEMFPMHITYGSASGDYELLPIRLDEWGEEQYYSIQTSPDGSILTVGDTGNMTVELNRVDHVLTLPNGCIHEAGDDYYVYVLDENGMKTVCFIEIGLVGNDITQVVSGLSEGSQVVKK